MDVVGVGVRIYKIRKKKNPPSLRRLLCFIFLVSPFLHSIYIFSSDS